ncbi:MAG: fumarate hydratase, partial [Nitrospirales bacterium]|nr:fumarate hydratase [Nitrospirales bacterium]
KSEDRGQKSEDRGQKSEVRGQKSEGRGQTAELKRLSTPLSEKDVRGLRVGEMVLISGRIVTGRDRVHKYLFHEKPPVEELPCDLEGGIIYHCGPLIRKEGDSYRMISAGPTTSMRVELYEAEVIRRYGVRGIIGKGGMGEMTLNAMRESGCVYLHTISGAAAYLADRIKSVTGGWKVEEFGLPEAMWILEVEDFPVIVTMDSHGNSLHRDVEEEALRTLQGIW